MLIAIVCFPWLMVMFLPWLRQTHWAGAVIPMAAVPALVLAMLPVGPPAATVTGFTPGFQLGLDDTGRGFLLPTALLWLLAGWFATSRAAVAERREAFAALWLVALGGNLLLILSQDLLAFYTGLAVMSFAAWGLVVHERSPEALAAGWLYLGMLLMAELALITAVAWAVVSLPQDTPLGFEQLAQQAPPLLLVLLGLGFGIKLGALGLHSWLPRAHPAAPVPASAVLSGAMIKAGVLGCWRLLEHGALNLPTLGEALLLLGIAAGLYGVAMGLRSASPKAMLGWSSVSQMGLAIIVFGLALAGATVWPALLIFVFHHGLAKGALFLGAGLIPQLAGRWHRLAWAVLWLPAVSLAAAPFTGGALAKGAMSIAAEGGAEPAWLSPALSLSSAATAALMWHFLWKLRTATRVADPAPQELCHQFMPYLVLVLAAAVLPWCSAWGNTVVAYVFSPTVIITGLWPLVLGVLVAVGLARVTFWQNQTARSAAGSQRFSEPFHPKRGVQRLRGLRQLMVLERRLHGWPVVGRLLMCLLLPLALVLWW